MTGQINVFMLRQIIPNNETSVGKVPTENEP